jgi:hypothetical protein
MRRFSATGQHPAPAAAFCFSPVRHYYIQSLPLYACALVNGRDLNIIGREMVMIDKHELCEKIRHLYPDVGECGIDVDADYDPAQKSWVVRLEKGSFKLKTYLEDGDAETCMLGRKCIGLGIEIAQLRANIERLKDA